MTKKKEVKKSSTHILDACALASSYPAENKAGGPATVLYQKMPDNMILIVGFENFLTVEGLEKKYGELICDAYMAYPSHMMMKFDEYGKTFVCVRCPDDAWNVRKGDLISKKEFSQLVAKIKSLGQLLHDIIIWQKENGIRKVKI